MDANFWLAVLGAVSPILAAVVTEAIRRRRKEDGDDGRKDKKDPVDDKS